jgi:hypothetical protein
MINQKTGLAELCAFEEYKKLQKNLENIEKTEAIKIIQANLMTFGVIKNECLRRIRKTSFHKTKKDEISNVEEQANRIIEELNSNINSLLVSGYLKKPQNKKILAIKI